VCAVDLFHRQRVVSLNPAGNPLTAEQLCREYAPRVYRFAAMLARDTAAAEDLAQEALLHAIRRLDQFDPARGSVNGWLWRIVANVAKDTRRLGARRHALWERLAHGQPEVPSVEAQALARLRDAEVLAAVRRLRPRDRAAIALRFGAGLDYGEIAAVLRISPAAASLATRRALARLRARLEGVRP
jgi:RNA polymerase sigma-70 factor (ECF subfamily)